MVCRGDDSRFATAGRVGSCVVAYCCQSAFKFAHQLSTDERGLLRAVKRILPADPAVELVLVIDQFEELFTLVTSESTRTHFLNSLITAVLDERSRLHVLVTLRADFTDRPLQYVDFGELLQKRTEFILPLSSDEMEAAIAQPVLRLGMTLERGLTAEIIRDVGDEPGTLLIAVCLD